MRRFLIAWALILAALACLCGVAYVLYLANRVSPALCMGLVALFLTAGLARAVTIEDEDDPL